MKNILIISLLLLCSIALFSQNNPITVLSPNGGESWAIGTTHQITWTSVNLGGNAKIQLHGGNSAANLITIAENILITDGSFTWTIPQTIMPGTMYKIRVVIPSVTPTSILRFDESDGFFTISGNTPPPTATLTLTSPNGGENWEIGSTHDITWTSTNMTGSIRIDLISPLSSVIPMIAMEVPVVGGVFSWTIPNNLPPASFYRIMVSQRSSNGWVISDMSDADFTISGNQITQSITVTSPNGGENWEIGSTHNITWDYTNIDGNVSIELISPLDMLMPPIAVNVPVTVGSYTWTIPNQYPPASFYRVNITKRYNNNNLVINDMSDADFTLSANPLTPTLTVTSPNGGESWAIGSVYPITWTSTNLGGRVRIELISPLMNPMGNIIGEANAESGVFNWTIPNTLPPASFYMVSVSSITNNGTNMISDISDGPFTITGDFVPMSITVVSPNGGENWEAGSTHDITWTYTNLTGNVRIVLETPYPTFAPVVIANEVPIEGGVFHWSIPEAMVPETGYRVTITWLSLLAVYIADSSDAGFTIRGGQITPSITVTSPNGGENWVKGTMHPITWNSTGIMGNVQIGLVRTNGINAGVRVIARNVPNTGIFNWNLPNNIPIGTEYRVIVRSQANHAVIDFSNEPFTISEANVNTFRVISPNGGEVWYRGAVVNILWTAPTSIAGNVEIALIRNNTINLTEYIIETGAPNTGSYAWTIPPTLALGRDYRIRVRVITNAGQMDVSDRPFIIAASPISITPVAVTSRGQVSFMLASDDATVVSASVYNIKGQAIKKLMNNEVISGKRTINWDGTNSQGKAVKNGLFFVKVNSGKEVVTRKFILK